MTTSCTCAAERERSRPSLDARLAHAYPGGRCLSPLAPGPGAASGAGACAELGAHSPFRFEDPGRVFFRAMTTAIATDLLTPLGAYLRLREQGRGSFLLESVEHGRLGRHS